MHNILKIAVTFFEELKYDNIISHANTMVICIHACIVRIALKLQIIHYLPLHNVLIISKLASLFT